MSKYNYFYCLTTPNNKLYYFVELLYQYAGKKIIVLAKNNEQIKELCSFLKTKSIYCECFFSDDFSVEIESLFLNTNIFIMTEMQLSKIEQKITDLSAVFNLYSSLDQEKIIDKYKLFSDFSEGKLIELISKVDFELVQLLYKNQEFIVNKHTVIDDSKKQKSIEFFMNDFIHKYQKNESILKGQEAENKESIFFKETEVSNKVQFLKDFYIWVNMYASIPTLNITDGNKKYKKIYIQINHGFADQLTKKQISLYLQSCPGVEAVEIKKMDENKVFLCIKGYSLKVNCVTQFIDTNLCNEQNLQYIIVSEEIINQECAKDKSSDFSSNKFIKREHRANGQRGNDQNHNFFGRRKYGQSYDKNKKYDRNNSRFDGYYKGMKTRRDSDYNEFDNKRRFDKKKPFDISDYSSSGHSDRYSSGKNSYFQKNQYGRYNADREKFQHRVNKKSEYRSFSKNKNMYNKDINYDEQEDS